jgi:hypothetical protein
VVVDDEDTGKRHRHRGRPGFRGKWL